MIENPIVQNLANNALFPIEALDTLKDRYLLETDKTPQDMYARIAWEAFRREKDDEIRLKKAQKIYDYMSKHWFSPATPILSNLGANRGLPVSCFINEPAEDSMDAIIDLWWENAHLASKGGGIGSDFSKIRSVGELIGTTGKTSGVIPFIKVVDSLTLAVSQGNLRRGSTAVYLRVDHPEIEMFLNSALDATDPNRHNPNLFFGVNIPDAFMEAVRDGKEWDLISPKTGEKISSVDARKLFNLILDVRSKKGYPYMFFIDAVNRAIPEHHKELGLEVKTSNLCSEICLPTTSDRTAICLLSSVNLTYFDTWRDDPEFIPYVVEFLDNIIDIFAEDAPEKLKRAIHSALQERSLGLGVMGFHTYLQKNRLPFGGKLTSIYNKEIFGHINKEVIKSQKKLVEERGPCLDALKTGHQIRNSYVTAIAPTASISTICGGTSPGIEPEISNVFIHKTLSGNFKIKNKVLAEVLQSYDKDTDEVWESIADNEGSVQHLDFLSKTEKDTFRTAFEIDMRHVIDMAVERQRFINQAQSVNLFFKEGISRKDYASLHIKAWKDGLKSLYYARNYIKPGESTNKTTGNSVAVVDYSKPAECLSCQ